MMKRRRLVIIGVLAASIYGTTYQQFRHFDLSDPRGVTDAESYIKMSRGDYRVLPDFRNRFIVPILAATLRPLIQHIVRDPDERDRLSFYIVNFGCTLASSWILVLLLEHLGFPIHSSLIGAFIFVDSRVTILVTGTPLADAPYFAAAITIVYLTLTGRAWALMVMLPLLVLVKEPLLLIALLPLLVPTFRRIGYGVALIASGMTLYFARSYIERIAGIGQPTPSLIEIVTVNIKAAGDNALYLLTPAGLHDLQNPYSLFLLFAILGFFTNRRTQFMPNHPVLLALIPISLLYAVLSGNGGRMFFVSFPAVIPYALIFIQDTLKFPTGAQSLTEGQ